nr:MAG TPA: hypothetical protein [Microviridae sp.]
MFTYEDLPDRMSCRPDLMASVGTTLDELVCGVKSLSDQVRSFRAGGLSSGTRELKDSLYDEDDSIEVDPSSEFGVDRFERSERIAATVSDRMAKKKKEKLEHAEV